MDEAYGCWRILGGWFEWTGDVRGGAGERVGGYGDRRR